MDRGNPGGVAAGGVREPRQRRAGARRKGAAGADRVKARAERDSAERNVNAMRELQGRGAASPAEVEEADNRYKKAQADVTALEQKQSSRYSGPETAKVQAQAGEARAAYEAAQS